MSRPYPLFRHDRPPHARSLPATLALIVLCLLAIGCGPAADPAPRSTPPSSAEPAEHASPPLLGVDCAPWTPWTLAREAGLSRVRITVRWSVLHPEPGRWDFSAYDDGIAAMDRAGVEILALLSDAPAHLGGGPRGTVPPANLEAWEEFVERVAGRWGGAIDAWEVWNEPDLVDVAPGVGWARPHGATEPVRWVDYLRVARRALDRHDPGAVLVAPTLSSRGHRRRARALLEQIETARFPDGRPADWIDAVSVHANAPGDASVDEVVATLLGERLELLDEVAPSLAAKPRWITETGWSTAAVAPAEQARRTRELLDRLAGLERVDRVYLYRLRDEGDDRRGLFTEAGEPKPLARRLAEDRITPPVRPKTAPPGRRAPALDAGRGGDSARRSGSRRRASAGGR